MASPEQAKSYQVIKRFTGVNTKANRTAIDESEFSWLENAMPVGNANMRITGQRTTITDSGGNNVSFTANVTYFNSLNLGLQDYLVAFNDLGGAEAFDVETKTKVTIAGAGTFTPGGVQISQWKNERMLIIDSAKGYFTWDGNSVVSVGSIGQMVVVNGGTGYNVAPTIVISAPDDANGVQAQAEAAVTGNIVTSVTITNAGTGYRKAPTVTLTGGTGSNANIIAGITTFATGTVNVVLQNGGANYSSPPSVIITGDGVNAAATAVVIGNTISTIVMTNPGSGYTHANVTLSGGGTPSSNAVVTATVNNTPNVDVQSFSGRVWIAQGRTVFYSAAGTYNDFTSVSAGNLTITDSTLHGIITKLLSANNFLYIFGDDSINVFSDVLVNSSGVTLFTNTNISASVGSKRPETVFPYFRSVLFMNDYGVYALVGSTTTKISDPLDGIFPDIDFTNPVYAGQVLLNNILCAAFNFRYYDATFTQSYRYIQAIFFDKRWFFTSQGNNLKFITSAPVSGLVNLYGIENNNLYQLYSDGLSAVPSIIQTALMPMNDPIRDKQALKFGVEATLTQGGIFQITVDSPQGSSPPYTLSNTTTWYNYLNNTIPWKNNSNQVISWVYNAGYYLYKSDAQQWGKYLGLTLTSNSAAFIVNTFEFEHELRARF